MMIYLLLLLPLAQCLQLPFNIQIPFFRYKEPEVSTLPPRIAIIGAGAGGSSAAFWIAKAKERFGLNVGIDVYEQSSYVGGRSTVVYPYGNTSLSPVELGASIFVQANKNLWRATDEFNLTRRDFDAELGSKGMGIWDGQNVILSIGTNWWDLAKFVWRYGFLSRRMTEGLVKSTIKSYVTLYQSTAPKWDNITALADTLGFTEMVSQTTFDYLLSRHVAKNYATEVVEAATRVNYGQNIDSMHALEGMCSMATDGATGIKGGNFQLFEKFLEYSNATVHLNTKVTSIEPLSGSSHRWTVESTAGQATYNTVILAAPFHSTGMAIPQSLAATIPQQPYVHLHVTLLITTSPHASSDYFHTATPPRMMLTTNDGFRQGGPRPAFNSISYHGEVQPGEWVVKIFSDKQMSDSDLAAFFGEDSVKWVYRKEWDAYPVLPPTTTFPPVRLDRGFFYVNSFEPFISTMETETVSARNVVDLMLNEEYKGLSICGRSVSGPSETNEKGGFVYGFDC